MNIGNLLAFAFGEAVVPTLPMFSLSVFLIQRQRKAKLGWPRTLMLFGIVVIVDTVVNAMLYFSIPSFLTNPKVPMWSFLQLLVFPLLISVATVILLWKTR